MKKSIRVYITGNIQGIYFRSFIKENAEKYNVKGFVRNLEDNRVEVFLEGNSEDVNKMIEICKVGPKHAQVRDIKIQQEKFQDLKNFKVLHI